MNYKDEFNKNLHDAYWGNTLMREEIIDKETLFIRENINIIHL